MKMKIISMLSAAMLLITLTFITGCSYSEKTNNEQISIVTTCFPPYDFAKAVTGGNADITMLLCPGAEAHSYEPTPLDIAKIQNCDIFIYIGGEGEVWADKILDSFDSSDITIIKLIDFVDPLPEEELPGASPNEHDHDHEHSHSSQKSDTEAEGEEYDEHIWTSPNNAVKCVSAIRNALCQKYTERSDEYKSNAQAYEAQLKELDRDFAEMAENSPNRTIVIGDRFPFRYLTNDYGLDYFAAFSGCSSESEPGIYTIAFLIDEITEHNINAVFYLEFSTKKLAEKLSSASGAEMLPLHSCHNVSKNDFENGITYIDLMRQNLNNLKEALYE